MRAATKEKSLADASPQDFFPICELSVERVPLTIRQQVSTLFGQLRVDYEGIFVHLLRYAHVQDDSAIIRIPNQWKLHQQDGTWPCCYATLNTFVRLLCAVGILSDNPAASTGQRNTFCLLPTTRLLLTQSLPWTA